MLIPSIEMIEDQRVRDWPWSIATCVEMIGALAATAAAGIAYQQIPAAPNVSAALYTIKGNRECWSHKPLQVDTVITEGVRYASIPLKLINDSPGDAKGVTFAIRSEDGELDLIKGEYGWHKTEYAHKQWWVNQVGDLTPHCAITVYYLRMRCAQRRGEISLNWTAHMAGAEPRRGTLGAKLTDDGGE